MVTVSDLVGNINSPAHMYAQAGIMYSKGKLTFVNSFENNLKENIFSENEFGELFLAPKEPLYPEKSRAFLLACSLTSSKLFCNIMNKASS